MVKEFCNFYLKSLFDVVTPSKRFNANTVSITENVGYPYVVRSSKNNGIRGYIDEDERYLNAGNTFSFGQDTATVFWQPQAYFTGDKIKVLKPKFDCTDEIAMYIIAGIEKTFSTFSWGSQSFEISVIENALLSLPIQTDEEGNPIIDSECIFHSDGYIPDFEYMQNYIAELEQERIEELEQYLVVSGLNDYELTEEDMEVLSFSGNSQDAVRVCKEMREFRCGDLFTSQTGDTDLQQKDVNGRGHIFINSGVENNGIKGMTDRLAKIFPANTISIDFWGNAYYRDFEYKMATHNHVFSLSGDIIKNEYVGLYIVSKMQYMKSLFSYSNMGTWHKIKELFIVLPIQTDETGSPVIESECKYHPEGYIPDWDFMERYIRAIEKIVIADVVKYKDEMIAKTREVTA